ncbi:phosducin-like protein [Amphiura filiformis]|uniref:phosducin-like protein n=1 Tax=Amphiura filiformis TaxID=82378 RepID=UPI003B20E480
MATLDDKLLGEKLQYYYSSSEGESGGEEDDRDEGEGREKLPGKMPSVQPHWNQNLLGTSHTSKCKNTGPKGVIEDWRRFKQLETEKRQDQDVERKALEKKLALTCRSHLDDEKEKEDELKLLEVEDVFLKQYWEQRKKEMTQILRGQMPSFGKVITLRRDAYVDAIDKENKHVTIMVHVSSSLIPACAALNGCFQCLAAEYPHVKFCIVDANDVDLSKNFTQGGVPALLVYKGGQLIGNFVRVSDQLGDDFFAMDVESFLQEHGLLPEKSDQKIASGQNDDEDSDLDLD